MFKNTIEGYNFKLNKFIDRRMVEEVTTLMSNSRLHAIIETAVEGIVSIDQLGIIQSFNPAAEKIFGYDIDEIVGRNVKTLMPNPYQLEHDDYLKNYIAGGTPKIIGSGREVMGLRKNGESFPMWLSVAEFYEGDQRYFAGFINDISTERTFQERATGFEYILERSVNEIYMFDADTLKFVRANQGALLNLQYSRDEILQLTPLDIKPEHTFESFEELMRPLRTKEIDKLEFTTVHQRKDKSCYPIEVHLELTEFESHSVFVAIILDITERVEALEKARLNQEQLAHMDRVSILGEMSAGIAHEINQPLTAITTYANAGIRRASEDHVDVNKLKELFHKITDSAHRAGDVILRLRKMLKPQSEQSDFIDVNSIISEAILLAKTDTRVIDFNFIESLEHNLPKIVADAVQILQVVLNIIRNAVDACLEMDEENMIIEVSTKLNEANSRIQVSIKDSGPGVAQKYAEQLFNPFFTTKESGMGVGLAICHSIVQEHGGSLWFSNNPDRGATFHFALPTALSDYNE